MQNNSLYIARLCSLKNNKKKKKWSCIAHYILSNLENIDKVILSKLKNWTMQRISKIDLAILRLAIYELLYIHDIPEKVTANEAVELAKTYGSNDSKSFVNGVLAKVIESKEETNGE